MAGVATVWVDGTGGLIPPPLEPAPRGQGEDADGDKDQQGDDVQGLVHLG